MPKRTGVITYNLAERGRKHNGTDRSDLDIRSMVNCINAANTQELVKSGDLFGYYGHEVRARFGMNPPDKWVNPQTGEIIRIEPALRTIQLSADSDGNVTTKHEFMETDDGKYAQNLYVSNAGGFSSAIVRKRAASGLYEVTSFDGFDYVRQPNYNTNRGDGMFDSLFCLEEEEELAFDSLQPLTPSQAAVKTALESAILHQRDSIATAIHSEIMIGHYQNEAMSAQQSHLTRQQKIAAMRTRQAERKQEVYDSLICPSVSFDSLSTQWDSFAMLGTSDSDMRTISDAKKARDAQKSQDRERVKVFDRNPR